MALDALLREKNVTRASDLYWHRSSGTDLGHMWIRTLIYEIAAAR